MIYKGYIYSTKKEFIDSQIRKRKEKHINILLDKLKGNDLLLCRLYCDYLLHDGNPDYIKKQIFQMIPQLCNKGKNLEYKNIIIFGAGYVGGQAIKKFGDKVIAFADNDKKIGTYKDGVPIILFQKKMDVNNIEIIIAASELHIHELLMQLFSCDAKKYDVYQFLLKRTESAERC